MWLLLVVVFQIVFEATNGAGTSGSIAFDDVSIGVNETCGQAASCDFETSWCMWSQDEQTDVFNMIRLSVHQLSTMRRTAIRTDATTDSMYGHFLWIDSAFKNRMTSIRSETLFATNYPRGACFSLAYVLVGPYPGEINVVVSGHLKSAPRTLFTARGNKGSAWNRAYVDIDHFDANFEIYIEIIVGAFGEIALDDLFLHAAKCADVMPVNQTYACSDNTTRITLDKVGT